LRHRWTDTGGRKGVIGAFRHNENIYPGRNNSRQLMTYLNAGKNIFKNFSKRVPIYPLFFSY